MPPPLTLTSHRADLQLTHDLPDAHHDPRDANQAFSRRPELRGGPDAGPVHAAVEGQLQAYGGGGSDFSPAYSRADPR